MWAACVSLPRKAHVTGRCSYLLNQAEGLCCKRRGGWVTSHLQVSGEHHACHGRQQLHLERGFRSEEESVDPPLDLWAGQQERAGFQEGSAAKKMERKRACARMFQSPVNIFSRQRLDLAERSSDERGGHLLPALRLAQPGGPCPGRQRSNVVPGSKHKCVFWAGVCTVELPPEEVLVPADNFTITFHHHISGKEQVSLVDPQYLPRRHVKLDPPSDLQSNVSSEHCVLTWSVSPALEPLAMLLSYELAFKRQEEAWEWARHKDHIVGVTWLKLEAAELDPGSAYEARLRVQMAALEGEVAEEERYEGVWSDWSQPACFAAPPRRGRLVPALGQSDSTLVAVSLFLLLSSLIYLLFKLSPRMKTALYKDVPSPGPFFQPLYSVHNGDFQTWIGARGASPQAGRDHAGPPRGALLEARVREAVALLHCDPADAWPSVGLEEEGGPGPGLPAGVLPAGHVEWGVPSPAYLPQEDWAPAGRPRLAPPRCEGSSGDYCALDCSVGS